ncbi:MAG: hypothetical protein ACRBHB_00210 [Arenicella sp.]
MDYEFEVQEPEEEFDYVPSAQMLIVNTRNKQLRVIIYFMANTALEISQGIATTSMGKVRLQYMADTPSGAYTASQTLRKIVFVFTDPQGMAKEVEFLGQKT